MASVSGSGSLGRRLRAVFRAGGCATAPRAFTRKQAVVSLVAAFVFFGLVYYFAVDHHRWPAALGFGLLMGLIVLGSQWYAGRRMS